MVFWIQQKAEDYVGDLTNLQNENGRVIAIKNGLKPQLILPYCCQINALVSIGGQRYFRVDNIKENKKDSILRTFTSLIAAACVNSYELAVRPSIQYRSPNFWEIWDIDKDIKSILRSQDWRARRVGIAKNYSNMGQAYEFDLKRLPETISQGYLEIDIDNAFRELNLD